MAILDLQRRIQESGRIRIGQQVPAGKGTRPAKLETFRLTSPNWRLIEAAAQIYGGTPQIWESPSGNQAEVITTTDTLPVIVPPTDLSFSQHYELWSAAGCQRRCDGATETITDGGCLCDPDARECQIHTRLSVMLAELPGVGLWRLETQGFNAARELQGAVDVIRMAARRGELLPATLRLEQRMTKRPGQGTRRFAVPVLDINITPAQLLDGKGLEPPAEIPAYTSDRALDADIHAGIASGELVAITFAQDTQQANIGARATHLTPVPHDDEPTPSIAEQAATQKPRKTRGATPIPKTGIKPRTVQEAANAEPDRIGAAEDPRDRIGAEHSYKGPDFHGEPSLPRARASEGSPLIDAITAAQLKKLSILLKEAGFDDRETRHAFVQTAINRDITSAKDLTKAEAHKVIDILENDQPPPEPPQDAPPF